LRHAACVSDVLGNALGWNSAVRTGSWREIQALRAERTGKAASDRDRKKTFQSALRQAEELAEAAEVWVRASSRCRRPIALPLLLWWALLLGLSSLARYESAVWTAAIDLDASPLASDLRTMLDIAADRVPARMHDILHLA